MESEGSKAEAGSAHQKDGQSGKGGKEMSSFILKGGWDEFREGLFDSIKDFFNPTLSGYTNFDFVGITILSPGEPFKQVDDDIELCFLRRRRGQR